MVSPGAVLTSLFLPLIPLPQHAQPQDVVDAHRQTRQEVSEFLAAQRRALTEADATAYVSSLAEDVVVLGTDSSERFELEEYRKWSAPMFSRGPRPILEVIEEHISVSDDGRLAWFDLHTRRPGLGDMRISGIARKTGDRWEAVQLNHSFLVPNEIVPALVERLQAWNAGTNERRPGEQSPRTGAGEPAEAGDVLAVKAVLTDLQRAAEESDADCYLGHLADDAVMLGTAAGERWEMSEYRPRITSMFAQRPGSPTTHITQNVSVAADGRYAWFDERLRIDSVAELRGTGVLRREGDAWKIVHFNKTIVIPNELAGEFMRLRDRALTDAELATRLLEDDASPPAVDPGTLDLSPVVWPEGELQQLLRRNRVWGVPQPAGSGSAGMVAGTSHTLAVRAGVEALRKGGTAMDAACTTALTQVTLNVGATVSFAGILTLVYYEAESGEVHVMMAPFATPLAELMPLTIPTPGGKPSGRTALVPGFMKGIESAHQRFGELPFASLFSPSIFFAERGVLVEGPLEVWMRGKTEVLSRLPATRAVFTNEQGEFAPHGTLLRQRALAGTLRRVAAEGANHMYTGDWARDFVAAVQAEGGKVSAEDLARYDVAWPEPQRTTYHEYEVYAASPREGGRKLVESLNLLELADLGQKGHYSESVESCYWLIQCAHMAGLEPTTSIWRQLFSGAGDAEPGPSKEEARRLWEKMQEPGLLRLLHGLSPREKTSGHSDGVVAIDAAGNVAALCHSIATVTWGTTGLFVNGVSIPDSAAYQQMRMVRAGPGAHLSNITNPAIVLKNDAPVLACSAVGLGLHEATLGCLHNVLDFGMSPEQALQRPTLMTAYRGQGAGSRRFQQVMQAGRYSDELLAGLRTLGQETVVLDPEQASRYRGYWIGIAVDPETGRRSGAVDRSFNGAALAEE